MQSIVTKQYLQQLNIGKIRLGLENITRLMERIGNPEKELKIIHIAGTNGKGSTSQMISSMLQKAGYKIGVYNSPHLITPCECICINNQQITTEQFELYLERVGKTAKQLEEKGIVASFFEVLTAVALLYFKEEAVDFVILEVGLGGSLDATNVIEKSLLSVITKISIDHKDILGDNLVSITEQKAGIIKHRGLVVTPIQEQVVNEVISRVSDDQGADVIWMNPKEIEILEINERGTRFKNRGTSYQLRLIGKHQAYNASLALKVIETLKTQNLIEISHVEIEQGLCEARWAGRFEKICDKPVVFVDGAHNVDGMQALVDTIQAMPKCYTIGIIGMLRDKEVEEMLALSCPHFDRLILTEPDNPRAMKTDELLEKAKGYHQNIEIAESIEDAAKMALRYGEEKQDSQIIAFGSLYMIGKIRTYFFA